MILALDVLMEGVHNYLLKKDSNIIDCFVKKDTSALSEYEKSLFFTQVPKYLSLIREHEHLTSDNVPELINLCFNRLAQWPQDNDFDWDEIAKHNSNPYRMVVYETIEAAIKHDDLEVATIYASILARLEPDNSYSIGLAGSLWYFAGDLATAEDYFKMVGNDSPYFALIKECIGQELSAEELLDSAYEKLDGNIHEWDKELLFKVVNDLSDLM